eukprot:6102918-Amphidinium_carterae.1
MGALPFLHAWRLQVEVLLAGKLALSGCLEHSALKLGRSVSVASHEDFKCRKAKHRTCSMRAQFVKLTNGTQQLEIQKQTQNERDKRK